MPGSYGPDGVILDLEDSVHADHKDAARLLVRNALRTSTSAAERMVRINQLPLGLEDLDAVVPRKQPDHDPDPQGRGRRTRSARSVDGSNPARARSAGRSG